MRRTCSAAFGATDIQEDFRFVGDLSNELRMHGTPQAILITGITCVRALADDDEESFSDFGCKSHPFLTLPCLTDASYM